jgi:DNA replication protein DnaC
VLFVLRAINKFIDIYDCYRDAIRKRVPELKDIEDFEVKFDKEVLPCINCSTGKSHSFFYRTKGEQTWIQVDEPGKCDACEKRELFRIYQKESMEERMRSIGERILKEYCHIPETLRKKAGFKNYIETDQVKARAKQNAIRFTKEFLDPTGERYNLFFMGSPGTGKTHLCTAIAKNAMTEGKTIAFLTTGQLISIFKSTYNKSSIKTEQDILNDIKNADLLILDDLGSEAIGGNDDWRKAIIFEVVECRNGKPTIYTTNLTDDKLSTAVGERVLSRLYENTKLVDLFTDDYRKRLQIK